ncbi:MAG: hypothetical protein R3E79_55240 [Caldilineaceae bacterium]
MQYPLSEKIGMPELLVGREQEFANFDQWVKGIPRRASKSRVILARRKSGKTAFVQRLFNQVWSENGQVIPFYLDIGERKWWYPDFAFHYFQNFATQYIAFWERDEKLVSKLLTFEQIRDYGLSSQRDFLAETVDSMNQDRANGRYDLLWHTASTVPHRFAAYYDQRILVMLDEFQNITQYIYHNEQKEGEPDETMAGSFHSLSESKYAPMLVTGSYVGWLLKIMGKYLEAGRLTPVKFSPYLTPEAGLEAVYRYAKIHNTPVTNVAATQINQLCMADPFFISCVLQSQFAGSDLTTITGVIETVNYELTNRDSEMWQTWGEYIDSTLQRVNDQNAKSLVLFLNQHNERYYTPRELKQELQLDLAVNDIHRKLLTLVDADLLKQGTADIDFGGLQDGTLNLILRNRFEKEIHEFAPDFKQEFHEQIAKLRQEKRRLQGMLNHLAGKLAENLLATEFRSRKRFRLSDYFQGVKDDAPLHLVDVRERVKFQRPDGKDNEIDVLAQSSDNRIVLVEVRKRQEKSNLTDVEDLRDKTVAYAAQQADQTIVPAFLALGGFTAEALAFCTQAGIATAEQINYAWLAEP